MISEILQQLINGIALGSIYALIALGYTMVYGILKLINFAHGDVYMVGAFVGYFAITSFHWGIMPAFLFAMIVCAILGVSIERFAYRPLRIAPRIAALTTAIGVSFLLENLGVILWSPTPRAFPQVLSLKIYQGIYQRFGVIVNNRQLVILSVSIGLMILLQFIVNKTKIGMAMRAVSFDRETAWMMGVNIDYVISFTFAIGSMLAAAGGVLVGIYFNRIDPLMGVMPGVKAFVAAVLGGIGSIPGAMVGGFILGIAEILVSAFIASTYRDAIAFAILIIILLVKPSGIFGTITREKV
jgi:branched-chain amino acid transport system permease protein